MMNLHTLHTHFKVNETTFNHFATYSWRWLKKKSFVLILFQQRFLGFFEGKKFTCPLNGHLEFFFFEIGMCEFVCDLYHVTWLDYFVEFNFHLPKKSIKMSLMSCNSTNSRKKVELCTLLPYKFWTFCPKHKDDVFSIWTCKQNEFFQTRYFNQRQRQRKKKGFSFTNSYSDKMASFGENPVGSPLVLFIVQMLIIVVICKLLSRLFRYIKRTVLFTNILIFFF